MNKVILMGRLTRDPEMRYSPAGQAIGRYSLAVNRSYKKDGEQEADFFNIVAFAGRGEFAAKYFRKGMMVAVCGELRSGSYEKDGVKHYSINVIASDQYFAESKASYESRQTAQWTPTAAAPPEQWAPPQQAYTPPPEQMKMGPGGFTPIDPSMEDDPDIPF